MQMSVFGHFGGRCNSFLSLIIKSVYRPFHSRPQTTRLSDMKVRLVPALQDNYMYLLIDEQTKECAAVDPVEPEQLLAAVKEEGATLTSILTTHHHWDHAGGNSDLVKRVGKLRVYGADDDRIDELTHKVGHDDKLKLGSLDIRCLFTPCHTSGHICYYVTGGGSEPIVFTGDTLFSGGCGRFFEGTPPQMYRALIEILSGLPANTKVYCGHEYTEANLKYAVHVEPSNPDIQSAITWAKNQRASNLPTIPTTIAKEMKINPFMRVGVADVQKHAGVTDPVKVMGFLRTEKDTFKAP